MRLSTHFSVAEFERSSVAVARGIDNRIPMELLVNAKRTAEMLERIRSRLSALACEDVPIKLSSGYRCLQLNRAVGSRDTSDHVKACAADWTAPGFGTVWETAFALEPLVNELEIGQLIYECVNGQQWIHTSTCIPERPANRVITVSAKGTQIGIHPVEA